MKHARQRYQQGSLRRVSRKSGADVWEYRFRNHAEPDSPMRQMTLSTLEYPTEAKVKVALQERVLDLNGGHAFKAKHNPTVGLLIDRFVREEKIEEILAQPTGEVYLRDGLAYSTARSYLSYLNRHIRPRWGTVLLNAVKPSDVEKWLGALPLAAKTRGHIKALMNLLFERAMLWDLLEVQRNPIELVRVKGVSKRRKKPLVLTPEQFCVLVEMLSEPHRTMVIVAMCTGLRVSEILALRWEHINFPVGTMLIQQGVVHGRIGPLKTEYSADEIPLDPAFAEVLLAWRERASAETGLLFVCPSTGGCFHASDVQQGYLRPAGEALGLVGLGWHTFRHTYRTLLDETGAPIGVQQKLMRHANVSTTMNVYGSAALNAKRQANSRVVEMVMKKAV
jgi:integrase